MKWAQSQDKTRTYQGLGVNINNVPWCWLEGTGRSGSRGTCPLFPCHSLGNFAWVGAQLDTHATVCVPVEEFHTPVAPPFYRMHREEAQWLGTTRPFGVQAALNLEQSGGAPPHPVEVVPFCPRRGRATGPNQHIARQFKESSRYSLLNNLLVSKTWTSCC